MANKFHEVESGFLGNFFSNNEFVTNAAGAGSVEDPEGGGARAGAGGRGTE